MVSFEWQSTRYLEILFQGPNLILMDIFGVKLNRSKGVLHIVAAKPTLRTLLMYPPVHQGGQILVFRPRRCEKKDWETFQKSNPQHSGSLMSKALGDTRLGSLPRRGLRIFSKTDGSGRGKASIFRGLAPPPIIFRLMKLSARRIFTKLQGNKIFTFTYVIIIIYRLPKVG